MLHPYDASQSIKVFEASGVGFQFHSPTLSGIITQRTRNAWYLQLQIISSSPFMHALDTLI